MTRRSYVSQEIENPQAYQAAIAARIRANGNKTRRVKLLEAIANDPSDFRRWLLGLNAPPYPAAGEDASDSVWAAYRAEIEAFGRRYGALPKFLDDQLEEWGGLSEKQLAVARRIFDERGEAGKVRHEKEVARRASAPPWSRGRQVVSGTVVSVRRESFGEGYRASVSLKGLVLTAAGSKLWTSLPWAFALLPDGSYASDLDLKGRAITFTVTVEPSTDDNTMGFGKRPRLLKEG